MNPFTRAPLRLRLAASFAGAVAAALVIFGGVVTAVVWRAEALEAQQKEAARLAHRARHHHEHDRDRERAERGAGPGAERVGRGAASEADRTDGPGDAPPERDEAGIPDEFGDDEDVERVVSAMLLCAPLVTAAAAALGFWLAKRSLRPLREASAQALAARASALELTLPLSGANDEWDELAAILNSLLAEARGSVARIQRFTADAAHELRTPLTTLIGEADLALRRERPVSELRASLEVVRAESQRMAQLVDALLSLSRADVGTLLTNTHADPVELESLLRDAASRAQARAERKQKPFAVDISFDAPAPHLARGEPVLLARALGNLLDNAVDHGGTKVALAVRTDERSICVRVADDGEGIAESLRSRLFERFARADEARSSDGFGLGLALSRAIAQAHGGGLTLLPPAPGSKGAAFELRLLRA